MASRRVDPDDAVLTPALVAAARTRMEAAAGLLSLRRALLYDAEAGVRDCDVARWLTRGEELRASGEVPTTRHDRLCLELIHLDSARGGVALVRAGMAMRRILDSRDPRAYGAQARLVIHLHEAHADQEASDTNAMARGVGLAQEDMDALNGDELARVERLLEARAQITAEIEALVTAARSRGAQVRH